MSTLKSYLNLIRFNRPIGSLLLLWPTLTALWLASNGLPDVKLIFIFTMGVFMMRSVGCILNDIADRHFDGFVTRTQNRPLATGQLSMKQAFLFVAMLTLIAFTLVCFTNMKTVLLSTVALLLAGIYPWMKRVTYWPQVVLGFAFAWAIPMAYMAASLQLPQECWLLFFATTCWAVAYDTLYAMVDREDDVKIGLKSTAVLVAPYDKVLVFICHSMVLGLYVVIGLSREFSFIFYLAVGCASLHALYQQWLIRRNERQKYFKAFLENNMFGLILFLGTSMAL